MAVKRIQMKTYTWSREEDWLRNLMKTVRESDDAILEEMMQRINQDPAYRDVKAPPVLYDRLLVQIEEYEKDAQ